MIKDWLSRILELLKSQPSSQDETELFLHEISQPAFIVANKTGFVLLANQEASFFFKRPIDNFYNLSIYELVQDDQPATLISSKQTKNKTNQHTDSKIINRETKLSLKFLPLNKDKSLVLVHKSDNKTRENLIEPEQFWLESFTNLIASPPSSVESISFDKILEWICKLANADHVALYLANEDKPSFSIKEIYGKNPGLPQEIPGQDLPLVQVPHIWQPGKRTSPISVIARSLSAKKIVFLASIPIGEPEAIIGVLIIVSFTGSPSKNFYEYSSLAASLIKNKVEFLIKTTEIEEKLLRLQEKIKTYEIIDQYIQEGILVLSSDLTVLQLNPSSVEILGYGNEEVLGQHIENILIGYDSISPPLELIKLNHRYQLASNQLLFRRNGEPFPANIHFLPVTSKNNLESVVVIIEDLSEKERIRQQTEQLEQRAYIGEVTSIFAHEVLNPLNNISTGLQLFSRTLPPDDPNQSEVTRLLHDSNRLVDLIKSVLATTRPNEYDMKPLDVGVILQRLVDRRMVRMRNAKISADLQIHLNTPLILGDLNAIEQVFNNILNNAIQAMGESGGEIIIKANPGESNPDVLDPDKNKGVEISIADTGPGIPSEVLERVFQPFFTTRTSGSGLGLTIVKRIVTMHKGKIRLESFPGGTIFYISFPAIKLEQEQSNQLEQKT
jgi:two-component system, NtrC family, sensor histidine kinase AtoS